MSEKKIPINAGYPRFDWDKHAAVLSARRENRTFADIGKEFGIAADYVRQMVYRMERRERALKNAYETPIELLPVRARNSILGVVYREMPEVDTDISADMLRQWLESGELFTFPNFGIESLEDVRHLLKSLGK